MGIKVLGVNHRTAPLEVRERFTHGAHEVPGALARVLAAGASGGVLLSTCNRTEFYLVTDDEPPPSTPSGRCSANGSRQPLPAGHANSATSCTTAMRCGICTGFPPGSTR